MHPDRTYKNLLIDVLETGTEKADRTGTGTISVFGRQARFDLGEGFPLLTTKSIHFKSVLYELLWFLSGNTNIRWLQGNGVSIWDEWADENGDLGPIYGKQWRSWPDFQDINTIDQLEQTLHLLRTDPDSRRIVVTAWNPTELPRPDLSPQENASKGYMALAPCHCLFQFYVVDGKLSCHMYQRSADLFLGVPFNIASYAMLTMMVANQTHLGYGELVISFGDLHLYKNHLNEDMVYAQLKREETQIPLLFINQAPSLFEYVASDFKLAGYNPHPAIKAPISV